MQNLRVEVEFGLFWDKKNTIKLVVGWVQEVKVVKDHLVEELTSHHDRDLDRERKNLVVPASEKDIDSKKGREMKL